jgi:hypothetical protein
MSKGLTVCPSSFRSYFLHRVRYPNLCVTGESYVVYRARQTGASHVRGPNHVPNAESIRRRTIKDTYPSRLEAEQEILFAEYECTLGKEVDLREMGKTAWFADCFRGTDLRRTFCAFFPAMTSSMMGNSIVGPQATYL